MYKDNYVEMFDFEEEEEENNESLEEEFVKNFDEELSFADQMKGIKVMKQDKVATVTPIMDPETSARRKKHCMDEKKEEQLDFFSTANMDFVQPHDDISYKCSGLQYGVMRKLKSGEYLPQTGVDLHHHTIEQAYKKVRKLIVHAYENDIRCLLIIHGKGEFSKPKALLKSYVAHWLRQMPEVLAYHTAMPYHGDKGATYVLIKKSDEAKENNRERFSKRR